MIDLNQYREKIDEIIEKALEEDIGKEDVTTRAIFKSKKIAQATVFSKENGILAGIPILQSVFRKVDPELTINPELQDGGKIKKDSKIVSITGNIVSILKGERTALNFLGRLSGIATLTYKFCRKVRKYNVEILDTRKTTPNMRILEKYAVTCGGGKNHRLGLYDMFLIKENHIVGAGNIKRALRMCEEYNKNDNKNLKIEIEVKNLRELEEALQEKAEWIMLDNMNPEDMKKAVSITDHRAKLEASGRVKLNNIEKIAETGVDFISIGCITHSAKSIDFSLLITS
ncbi:carboxylating nicotinate-nucleotide diphosphorylase [candidate division KSB1 bacterium]|nr:MAG: carboxylating nicotinate-nucleotide diphosphorylase [candidate division KSB1 bacterium]